MKNNIALFGVTLKGGGAENVISKLMFQLNDCYDFHLILLDEKIVFPIPENVRVSILKNTTANNFFNILQIPIIAFRLNKYCKQNKIQLCLSFLNRPNWINCFTKLLSGRHKIVISERTTSSRYYNKTHLSGRIGLWLIKKLYPLADLIVPNSKGVQYDLEKRLQVANSYHLIYNPVKIVSQQPLTKKQKEFFTFIFTARFQSPKDHATIIKALALLPSLEDIRVQFLGEGEYLESCKAIANDLGIGHIIEFVGFVKDTYAYLLAADCFIFSSTFEGFPNVILEALACGLPVISTDCLSGPREILAPFTDITIQLKDTIEYAEYGVLIPMKNELLMAEAMQAMVQDETMRNNYSQKAILRENNFNVSNLINEFITIFENHDTNPPI